MTAPAGTKNETADARGVALDLLGSVLGRRQPLDEAIAAHRGIAALDVRDRAFARNLVATTLRRLGQIDALIAHALTAELPAEARPTRDILRLGAAQLAFLGTPAHAAVDTSVTLAEARGQRRMKALVNAVLRRLAREAPALVAAQDAARLNTPDWLWRSWAEAYGEAGARAIAVAHLEEAPLDLSVRDAADAERWRVQLGGVALPTGSIRCDGGGAVPDLPGFAEGAWWVQDAAAALPARLLGDIAGRAVLDLCAAPGGKTAQLAAMGARVTAIDRSPARLGRLKFNLARLSLSAETIAADAATWRPPELGPFVVLDAPCSATGTIRRHPDIAWTKRLGNIVSLAKLQASLLDRAVWLARPGGAIVYCTCSLEPEECEDVIAELLAQEQNIRRVPISAADLGIDADMVTPTGELRTLPCHFPDADSRLAGVDGFFAAKLKKL